jgi:hypothetical protein
MTLSGIELITFWFVHCIYKYVPYKIHMSIFDFKLSPWSECHKLSSGSFTSICNLSSNVSEHCLFHLHRQVGMKCDWGTLHTYSPMKMEQA